MKSTWGFLSIIVLLFVGLTITPAIGAEADTHSVTTIYIPTNQNEIVTLEFIDTTGPIFVRKELTSFCNSSRNNLSVKNQSNLITRIVSVPEGVKLYVNSSMKDFII